MTDRKLLKLAKKANEALKNWKEVLADKGFNSPEEIDALAAYVEHQLTFEKALKERPTWKRRKK